MSTDAYDYHGPWPVVIKAFRQRFSTNNMLHEAKYLSTKASQKPDEDVLEFETHFFEAKRHGRHIFQLWKNIYYVHGLKRFICEAMSAKLRCLPPNVPYNSIYTKRIAAAKGFSHRSSIAQVHPKQWRNTKCSMKESTYICARWLPGCTIYWIYST